MGEQAALLDDVAGAAAELDRIPFERGPILNEYLSVRRYEKPIDELQRCGFARPAAAQQDEGFALPERQA
jgi:hypothetical protein